MGLKKSNTEMIVSAGNLPIYESIYSSIPIYARGTALFNKAIIAKAKGTLRLKFNLKITPNKVIKIGMVKNGIETIVINQTVAYSDSSMSYDFKVNVNDSIMFKAYRIDDSYSCYISYPIYGVKVIPIEGSDS